MIFVDVHFVPPLPFETAHHISLAFGLTLLLAAFRLPT